jgi:cytosine deaminase
MWILNACIPHSLIERSQGFDPTGENWVSATPPEFVRVHLHVTKNPRENAAKSQAQYTQFFTANQNFPEEILPGERVLDHRGGLLLPCFVDIHTHLDKGHIWNRTPNPDGTFGGAMGAVHRDAQGYWTEEDLYRRMSFGLKCSYAHGTLGIRTHLDSSGELGLRVWRVFQALQQEWRGRIHLEAVALVPPQDYFDPDAATLWQTVAETQGILGGFFTAHPQLEDYLDQLFTLGKTWHLPLDLHVDETLQPQDQALLAVAQATLRHHFTLPVVCGHCCSLSVQPPEDLATMLTTVKAANLGIVSLPLCNLYLQDRQPQRTPRWRGVTALQELKAAGIPVALASDNCRDPFYAFGDHDGLEVFRESVRIAHLDHPYGDWIKAVTTTPMGWMGLGSQPPIRLGASADFMLFKARNWNELLSRPHSDRRIFRNGEEILVCLPDYEALDSN